MRRLLGYFLRGLVVLTPLALTAYVVWWVLRTIDGWLDIDGWLGVHIPGIGVLATILVITIVGFLASTVITRSLVSMVEDVFARLPFIRLLYTSTRDLLNAFVGSQKRFDRPVLLSIGENIHVLGFVTRETLDGLPGLPDAIAVYCPQSYNFAGQVIIAPSSRVQPVNASASEALAFIVSGGISGATAHATDHIAPDPGLKR
jgi:uncharacterized membrane protein